MSKHLKNKPYRGWFGLAVWLLIIVLILIVPFVERHEIREFQVLAVNDIYRVLGVDGERSGSIARLHTLRRQMSTGGKDVLLLHAGDFLYPSVMSREFDGEQMVGAMNLVDGNSGKYDTRMFVVPGNHEFDKKGFEGFQVFKERLQQSEFAWLSSNISLVDNSVNGGDKSFTHPDFLKRTIIDINGIKVGLFGITIDTDSGKNNGNPEDNAYAEINKNYVEVAREETAALRNEAADVVIALTHLEMKDDRHILDSLGVDGPDIIFGGHEHDRQWYCTPDGRCVVKADADNRSATIAMIRLDVKGNVSTSFRFQDVDERASIVKSEMINDYAQSRFNEFQEIFCRQEIPGTRQDGDKPPVTWAMRYGDECLKASVGKTQVELSGMEMEVRRYETNLGDWIADQMISAGKEMVPDDMADLPMVAFINSGSLRLNQNIPAGAITLWDLENIFQYETDLKLIEIDMPVLQKTVNRSVENWTGQGHWLQVSGFAFRHDIDNGTASDLTLIPSHETDVQGKIIAVTSDFLVDPALGDQDGYKFLSPDNGQVIPIQPKKAITLKSYIRTKLELLGEQAINPRFEGRICSSDRPATDCLL